jgi:hypothetical protein
VLGLRRPIFTKVASQERHNQFLPTWGWSGQDSSTLRFSMLGSIQRQIVFSVMSFYIMSLCVCKVFRHSHVIHSVFLRIVFRCLICESYLVIPPSRWPSDDPPGHSTLAKTFLMTLLVVSPSWWPFWWSSWSSRWSSLVSLTHKLPGIMGSRNSPWQWPGRSSGSTSTSWAGSWWCWEGLQPFRA